MIAIEGLTKRYRRVTVVDDLSFTALPGRVTGLFGPNGAGKTQTIRMLLGLVRPTAGTATIDGRPLAAHPNPAAVVGTVLDGGAFHPGRTGRAALRAHALTTGVPVVRVDAMLDRVGLADAAGRRVRTYSLGMRQRLALAQGLLADPAVVIADEPANGLDPEGIVWLRRLLRGLAAEGHTVVVSNHLLAEAERLVDDAVVIAGGHLVAAGPLAALHGGTTTAGAGSLSTAGAGSLSTAGAGSLSTAGAGSLSEDLETWYLRVTAGKGRAGT